MKTLIIYTSYHHQNTKKVAEVMADVLKAKLLEAAKANKGDLKNYDLIGFGSGIFFWKHHKSLLEFVEKLPKQNKLAFVFSTSGKKIPAMHNSLKDKLKRKGFEIVGEFNCPGWDTFGPLKLIGGINKDSPTKSDLDNAREFAKTLLKSILKKSKLA